MLRNKSIFQISTLICLSSISICNLLINLPMYLKNKILDNHLCENLKFHKFYKVCEEDANWLHAHVQQTAVTDVNIHHVTELNSESR
jgi:hypothetical protein